MFFFVPGEYTAAWVASTILDKTIAWGGGLMNSVVSRAEMRHLACALFMALMGNPLTASAQGSAAPSLVQRIKAAIDEDVAKNPRLAIDTITDLLVAGTRDPAVSRLDLADLRQTLSGAYFYLRDYDASLRELDQAIKEMDALGMEESAPALAARKNRASLISNMGRHDEALVTMLEILPIRERVDGRNSYNVASVLNDIANVHSIKGDYINAEKNSREATKIARALADAPPSAVATYWSNWVNLLVKIGEIGEALAESRALIGYVETKLGQNHLITMQVLNVYGMALQQAGHYAESEATLRRALAVNEALTNDRTEDAANIYSNIGYSLQARQRPEEALDAYANAYEIAVKSERLRPHAVDFMLNIAQVMEGMGNENDAFEKRKKAYATSLASLGESHIATANASRFLGFSHLRGGDFRQARALLASAQNTYAKRLPENEVSRLNADLLLAIADYRLGDLTAYERALNASTRMRSKLMTEITRPAEVVKLMDQLAPSFAEFAVLALESGRIDAGLQALQLSQMGDLDQAGAALVARQSGAHGLDAHTVRELQDAKVSLAKLQRNRTLKITSDDLQGMRSLDTEISVATSRVGHLQDVIKSQHPEYSELIRPDPSSLKDIQRSLKVGEALLYVAQWRNEMLSLLVAPDRTAYAKTSMPAADTRRLVHRYRDSISQELIGADLVAQPFDADAAYRLYAAMVPAKLEDDVAKVKHLYVVGAGQLASIPFASLVSKEPSRPNASLGDLRGVAWLIKRQAISTPISLRMIGHRGAINDARHALQFAGIGAPALTGSPDFAMRSVTKRLRGTTLDARVVRELPALPETAGELARMKAALGGNGRLITGDEATEETLRTTDLSKYNVLAFATHGLVSGELRGLTEPGLVLTPAANDDGVFTASDVANLKLNADWVILSACDTAAGESANAPMYSGLARAFVYAGARSLLLSHWQVRDDIASRLTVETVKASRRGMPRAEALRQAQLRLINDKSVKGGAHPALWAPFVLLGN